MRHFLLLLSLAWYTLATAQFTPLARSASFPEQQGGYVKLLILPNGNTVHAAIVVSPMAGMPIFGRQPAGVTLDLTIYDPSFKEIARKKVPVDLHGKMFYEFTACFSVNNDIVAMITGFSMGNPMLKRMVLDGTTGDLTKEDDLVNGPQMTSKDQKAFMAGNRLMMPWYIAKKDPFSENYAVSLFGYPNGNGTSQITIMHFNSTHKTLTKTVLKSPDNKFAVQDVLDIAVIDDKQVEVLHLGYNISRKTDRDNLTYLTTIKAGGEQSAITLQNKTNELTQHGLVRFNPATNQLFVLTLDRGATEERFLAADVVNYNVLLSVLDQSTKKVLSGGDAITVMGINQTYRDYFQKRKNFGGVPENLIVNRDGSYCILLEGLLQETRVGSGNTGLAAAGGSSVLGDLAVLYYAKDRTLVSSSLVPKSHAYVYVEPMYMADRDVKPTYCVMGFQYKSATYLNGKNKSYVLMNDIEANGVSAPNGKVTKIMGLSECDAFAFDVSPGAKPLPDRKLVFGNKEGHSLGFFSTSAYDAEKNIFVTLEIDRDKGDKMSRLVWLKPE
ncbi:MAG: hypothetical protein U0T84_05950 [Chitinophagales bacterium]